MHDFQNEIQMLNVGDFQASEAVPWDQNQYYDQQYYNQQYNDDSYRQFGGFARCFSCFSCFNCFRCFNCFNCFRCHHCFRCGGRCGVR